MNSYEITMLFNTEEDADRVVKAYESYVGSGSGYLESLLPALFTMNKTYNSENFYAEVFKRNTNEININCIGTKYPSIKIQDLFNELQLAGEHGIKLKSFYDGDGNDEYYYVVNGSSCSSQKYSAFFRKLKIKDSSNEPNKKSEKVKKKVEPVDPPVKKNQKELISKMDYGKDKKYKTALIRLQTKSDEKSERIYKAFEQYKNIKSNDELMAFKKCFNELLSSRSKKVYWSKEESQLEDLHLIAPENFMFGLRFVITEEECVYLGFDTDDLKIHSSEEIHIALNNLVLIFGGIDGVKKVWIKYRSGKNPHKEWKIRHPVFGGSTAKLQNMSEDYKW